MNRIIWLEDEPETIDVLKNRMKRYCGDITICQSFSRFSTKIKDMEDSDDNLIIIDIRMIFNKEIYFNCFEKRDIRVTSELDSGFEYFNECLNNRFKNVKIVFYSSKPRTEAIEDAKKHNINRDLIVSKEYSMELLNIAKRR
jgi:DNA-binding NarL/FixJ family response regulator